MTKFIFAMWLDFRIFAVGNNTFGMTKKQAIQLFEEKKVRTVWDDEQEKWYFSIVDTVAVLTDSPNPNNYWKVLKHRLKKEGNQSVTNCNQLKSSPKAGGTQTVTNSHGLKMDMLQIEKK